MNKFDYKNLTPFKWFVLENFPFIEADFDALTEWQLFCKLGKEINKIIDSQNIVGEQAENLTNAFNNLKNYVDNYFDNLDVQAEINNKLNEMAENGTLQEIISAYLKSKAIFGFDNVASMKEATNLIDGSYARTYGYYKVNDGGGATYKIRTITNDDVVDEKFIIAMSDNTLIAELVYGTEINLQQLGAKADGSEDISSILQTAVDKAIDNKVNKVYIPSGNYLLTNTVTIKENSCLTIEGESSASIMAGIKIGTTISTNVSIAFLFKTPSSNFKCRNMNFYSVNPDGQNDTCFKVDLNDTDGYFSRCMFEQLQFRNYKYGIDLYGGNVGNYVDGSVFRDLKFDTVYYCIRAWHLECSEVSNIIAEPFIGYILFIYQSHTVEISNILARGTTATDNNEVAFIIKGTNNYGENCYIHNVLLEDVKYILFNNTPHLTMENIFYTNVKEVSVPIIQIGGSGGTNPIYNTFKNFEIRFETGTPPTEILKENQDITHTYDTENIRLNYGRFDGLYVEGIDNFTAGINAFPSAGQINYKFQFKDKYIENDITYYCKNGAETGANTPDGTSWSRSNIVKAFTNYRVGNTMGFVRNHNNDGFEPLTTPTVAYGRSYLVKYHPDIIGYPAFNTDSKKPCWWNGTAWVYSDGTTI